MSRILSLAAGSLPEFQPPQVAEAAGCAGLSHVGFTIEPDNWNNATLKETKAAIAAHDLNVLDVEVIWIPEGGKLDDSHKMIIDAGLELGAPNALVVSSEPDMDRTAEALHQLCKWGGAGDMRIALEFLMITAVQSMNNALQIIEKCDHPAAALLIDTIHFQRAGHAPEDLGTVDPRLLPYSQICDGDLKCEADFNHYLEDAIDLRSVPGEGELPVGRILKELPKDIPLSLEIRSRHYRETYPNAIERAAAIRAKALEFFDRQQIAVGG